MVNQDFSPSQPLSSTLTLIRVDNAYEKLAQLLSLYNSINQEKQGVEEPSFIDPTAKIGNNVYIGAFCYIGKNQKTLHEALQTKKSKENLSISILTGPEGDLSPEESERVIQAGFIPVSLGPRILRADTAPISIISIIQYTLGEMP